MKRTRTAPRSRRHQRGISLLEILITVIILAVGLLGLALLQTMNLRYTQSANYRTVATNLSYEVLDLVRANQLLKRRYAETTYVSGGTPATCNLAPTFDPGPNLARWHCQVSSMLPGGESQVSVLGNTATVRIRWTDARWEAVAANQRAEFVLVTTL